MNRRAILTTASAVAAIVLSAGPALAAPTTLTCTAVGHLNWWSGEPALLVREEAESETGEQLFHVDPRSGEWYRQLTSARSLTQGGGTFAIVNDSEWRWFDQWVGIDGAHLLRIRGGEPPLSFLLVDADGSVYAGTCIEPETPFMFLARP